MRALLDTCTFLWFISGSNRMSDAAKALIANFNNELFFSTASLWEIAIKTSLGKLELFQPFQFIPDQLHKNEIGLLTIHPNHLSVLIDLPFHHRDPFDRLIIAQGIKSGLPIITNDNMFSNYDVDILW